MIIGPPGAGKTTALLNCRAEVPAGRRDGAERGGRRRRHAAVRLVVHRDAVLIDTAGRYTTQDSDAAVDRAGLGGLSRPAEAHPRRASR